MTIWMRLLNDVTSAIGTEMSRTADLFTVFWTKSAMVGYSFACQGSREYDRHL